jgi:hypothetical protein
MARVNESVEFCQKTATLSTKVEEWANSPLFKSVGFFPVNLRELNGIVDSWIPFLDEITVGIKVFSMDDENF